MLHIVRDFVGNCYFCNEGTKNRTSSMFTYLLNTVGVVRGVAGASCKVRSRDLFCIM